MRLTTALLLPFFVAGTFACQTHAAAAQSNTATVPIVIRVSGPVSRVIAVGRPLPREQIRLGPLDQITLTAPTGTRIITGPGIVFGNEFMAGATTRRRSEGSALGGVRGSPLTGPEEKTGKATNAGQQAPGATKPHSR
jgi:hypothetical protein